MTPFWVPDLDDSLHYFGAAQGEHLPDRLKILIWNVYKGKKGSAWKTDFLNLTQDCDIVLMQEAMLDETMPGLWKEDLKHYQWKMATSFIYRSSSHRTGVATGAKFTSKDTKVFRGFDREIFVWTPKVTISSLYQSADLDYSLLVINTHALLVTTTKAFIRYIDGILSTISHHKGPLIFAGDFNTWHSGRWIALLHLLKSYDLEHVVIPNDERKLKLDHVFVRGLDVVTAKVWNTIYSSDHSPLELQVQLKK